MATNARLYSEPEFAELESHLTAGIKTARMVLASLLAILCACFERPAFRCDTSSRLISSDA